MLQILGWECSYVSRCFIMNLNMEENIKYEYFCSYRIQRTKVSKSLMNPTHSRSVFFPLPCPQTPHFEICISQCFFSFVFCGVKSKYRVRGFQGRRFDFGISLTVTSKLWYLGEDGGSELSHYPIGITFGRFSRSLNSFSKSVWP